MDNCFIDVTIEFLSVAFHSILYYTSVYPKSVFESRKKYNIVVYRSIHPEVNQYIDLCLKNITECLKSNQLNCIQFDVTDYEYKPKIKFIFQIDKKSFYDDTMDAYLIETEQNIRAFCLKLASFSSNLKDMSVDTSFSVYIHTNESTAVSMTVNPAFEEFPMIEVEDEHKETDQIIPLRRFSVRSHTIDAYIEVME